MTINDARTTLEREFTESINELQAALQHAADATARIQSLVPRVGSISNLFAELDNVIRSGREQIGDAPPSPYTRPTLVLSGAPARASAPQPFAATTSPASATEPGTIEAGTPAFEPVNTAGLTSFRLEFESNPGPLDLRTVDDAVSEHPAVRDVALLDYDGRKATLKVWIEPTATPSDIQSALVEKSTAIFSSGNDVTIVALEDVA